MLLKSLINEETNKTLQMVQRIQRTSNNTAMNLQIWKMLIPQQGKKVNYILREKFICISVICIAASYLQFTEL